MKHRERSQAVRIWVAASVVTAVGCGPSILVEGSEGATSNGPDAETGADTSGPGHTSSGTTGSVSQTGAETSSATSLGPTSTGQGPTSCERGSWSGSLNWSTGFSGFTVRLSVCDSELEFEVAGLDIPSQRNCTDGGLVEIWGLLCASESGGAVLTAESIVGPCDGACGLPGQCAEFERGCLDDNLDCDLVAQDCPPGTKCAPWVVDGGPVFIGATCRDVEDNPDGLGDPCTADDDGRLGRDSCDTNLLCWGPDVGRLPWQCIEQCDPMAPTTCGNGEVCSACPSLPPLGLCLPPDTPTPIARCDGS